MMGRGSPRRKLVRLVFTHGHEVALGNSGLPNFIIRTLRGNEEIADWAVINKRKWRIQNSSPEKWSRDPDLNRRPADCPTDTMLSVLNAFSLTSHYDKARYLARIVRNLFAAKGARGQ